MEIGARKIQEDEWDWLGRVSADYADWLGDLRSERACSFVLRTAADKGAKHLIYETWLGWIFFEGGLGFMGGTNFGRTFRRGGLGGGGGFAH